MPPAMSNKKRRLASMDTRALNDCERWLVDCCRLGRKADFDQRGCAAGEQPEISADLIRRLALGQFDIDGDPVLLPLGLQVKGAKVYGRLQLANASGSNGNGCCAPLVFEHCRFETGDPCPAPDQRTEPAVDLRHARCSHVAFIDCELSMLALNGALIAGDLDLSGLRSSGGDAGQCWVQACGAHVEGGVILSRARLRLEQAEKQAAAEPARTEWACDLHGMVIERDLVGSEGMAVFGGMTMPRQVLGDIDLRGAMLVCDRSPMSRGLALMAERSEVGGVLWLRPMQREYDILPFECHGIANLYSMKIGGSVELSGGRFFGPAGQDAQPAIFACMLNVSGSLFMHEWAPRNDLPSFETPWPTVACGSSVDFRGATVGKSMLVALQSRKDAASLICSGLCVGNVLQVELANKDSFLQAVNIGGDLNISAADDATPSLYISDSAIGGNLWLTGGYNEIRAQSCSVEGRFSGMEAGGAGYQAGLIVASESRIQGLSHFQANRGIDIAAARLMATATISSAGKAPGISIRATSLRADHDVIIKGRAQAIDMTRAAIGGDLNAAGCSSNEAALHGIRVGGDVKLPRDIFGLFSLASGRIEGAVELCDIDLHLRLRPEGDTKPGIDLGGARIEGDLKVARLVRKPEAGAIKEAPETPAWFASIDAHPSAWDEVLILHRDLSFYSGAQVVELHLPSARAPDEGVSSIEMECHAFLLLGDGRTVYLNGQSQPIHRVNEAIGGKRLLRLDNATQALDYLRFFCAYVWGDQGAFIIIESLQPSDWLQYMERDEKQLAQAPAPPQIRREGEQWLCSAVVQYADYLFASNLQIAGTGMVAMNDDTPVARLQAQDVLYSAPCRRYRLAPAHVDASSERGDQPPPHHTPHEVMRDHAWARVTDATIRSAVIDRIRSALTELKKLHVTEYMEAPVLINLHGCRCNFLDDDDGKGWGNGLTVDLRGFEYQGLAESQSEANKAFSGSSVPHNDTVGALLGRQRNAWLERVTRGLDFSVTPYEQLGLALAGRGDQEAARTVLERRLQCENELRPWFTRWSIWLGVQLPFRYGLFSKRGIVVTLLYWLLGIVAFDIANYGALRLPPVGAGNSQLVMGQLPLPIRPVLVVDSQPVTMSVASTRTGDKLVTAKVPLTDNLAEEVSCGEQVEPSLYALDVMLPLVDLRQESKCAISSADGLGPFLWRVFRALYAIAGAYMTSMLILTLSGVLRRSTER